MEYQEGNVTIDGIKIHYYRSGGKKPPMVLLHGATDDGLCWGRTAQELAERYDVIMPDAQGHGLSDRLGAGFFFSIAIRNRRQVWSKNWGWKGQLSWDIPWVRGQPVT